MLTQKKICNPHQAYRDTDSKLMKLECHEDMFLPYLTSEIRAHGLSVHLSPHVKGHMYKLSRPVKTARWQCDCDNICRLRRLRSNLTSSPPPLPKKGTTSS